MFGYLNRYREKLEIHVTKLSLIEDSSEEMNLQKLTLRMQDKIYPVFNEDLTELIALADAEAALQK